MFATSGLYGRYWLAAAFLAYQAGARGGTAVGGLIWTRVGVDTGLFIWGQSALNRAWQGRAGGAATFRVHPVEWALILVGGLLRLIDILGAILP